MTRLLFVWMTARRSLHQLKFAGMAFVMEENESLYPVAISCFRAQTQMPEASHFGDLIEQLLLDHD